MVNLIDAFLDTQNKKAEDEDRIFRAHNMLDHYMDVLKQVYTLGHMQHFEHQRKQGEY